MHAISSEHPELRALLDHALEGGAAVELAIEGVGTAVVSPFVVSFTGAAGAAAETSGTSRLAEEIRAHLGRGVVLLPRIGELAERDGAVAFRASPYLKRRLTGIDENVFPDDVLDGALAAVRGPAFGIAQLELLFAPLVRAKGVRAELLDGWPRELPRLLRATLGRSAEVGGEDAFGFLSSARRERLARAFRIDDDEAIVVSGPSEQWQPERWAPDDVPAGEPVAARARCWLLRREHLDAGLADPPLACMTLAADGRPRIARTLPLTAWVQLHAVETVLVARAEREGWFLSRAQCERIRDRFATAFPDLDPRFPDGATADAPWWIVLRRILAW